MPETVVPKYAFMEMCEDIMGHMPAYLPDALSGFKSTWDWEPSYLQFKATPSYALFLSMLFGSPFAIYGSYAVLKYQNICSLYLYMVSIIFLLNVLQ